MAERTLAGLGKKMAAIDFRMLESVAEGGAIAARPMSNAQEHQRSAQW